MLAIKFTYDIKEVLKVMAKHYGCGSVGRLIRVEGNALVTKLYGDEHFISPDALGAAFGAARIMSDKVQDIRCRVKVVGKGAKAKLHVWKKLLTYDEFLLAMRRHNVGFKDRGNPRILNGVVVYSPSASHWKRHLWTCPLKSRSYRINSAQEVFLENDPSAGLIRHPYAHLDSLDGQEHLLRWQEGWRADYCYIEGYAK